MQRLKGHGSMRRDYPLGMAPRFDNFVRNLLLFCISIHVIAIVFDLAANGGMSASACHLGMALAALFIALKSRDGMTTLIFGHVYLTFSFMTYLYAFTHLQSANGGLYDPTKSALIALISQLSLVGAFMLSSHDDVYASVAQRSRGRLRWEALLSLSIPLIVAGVVGVFLKAVNAVPDAVSEPFITIMYLGLSVRVASRGRFDGRDHVSNLAILTLIFMSVASNQRTGLLAAALWFAFLLPMAGQKVLTPRNIIVGYIAWRLLVAFSAVAISIRWARDYSNISMVALFIQSFFSWDTLFTLLNPFYSSEADSLYRESITSLSGFYSPFFGQGLPSDLIARLTILPQMDIVTSQLPGFAKFRWEDLYRLIMSALPSFGQDKDLIFSDRIVWELGLSNGDSIGRPMITAEGEIFAIGGYLAVGIIIPMCFYILNLAYRAIWRSCGSRVVAILMMSQFLINTIFSTTFLSLLTISVRAPIQLMVLVFAVYLIAAKFTLKPSENVQP